MESNPLKHRFKSIKSTFEFDSIYNSGKKIKLANWLLIIVIKQSNTDHQNLSDNVETFYGVTVSRKVGKAVLRNKLKRWVRNTAKVGLWPKKLYGKKTVFIFRPQPAGFYDEISYADFRSALENLR